jgi:hypothetical protein
MFALSSGKVLDKTNLHNIGKKGNKTIHNLGRYYKAFTFQDGNQQRRYVVRKFRFVFLSLLSSSFHQPLTQPHPLYLNEKRVYLSALLNIF